MSVTCGRPAARPSSTLPIRASRKPSPRSQVREGWHSHKVRVAGDIMIVNQEKFGKSSRTDVGGGIDIYDVSNPSQPKLITEWRTVGGGVHRFDFDGRYAYISPTVEGYIGNIVMILDLANPAKPTGGRPLVDSRPVGGRRRALSVGELGVAALPSPAACRRSALCELLASWLLHPRYLRHVEAEAGFAHEHQPGFSASDAHLPGDAGTAEGPEDHDRGGRRRRQAVACAAGIRLDLRHHAGATARSDLDVPGAWPRQGRQPAAADDGMPSAVGAFHRHGRALCVVRAGAADRRLRGSLRAEGSRSLSS